jgi:hypothetical protein
MEDQKQEQANGLFYGLKDRVPDIIEAVTSNINADMELDRKAAESDVLDIIRGAFKYVLH